MCPEIVLVLCNYDWTFIQSEEWIQPVCEIPLSRTVISQYTISIWNACKSWPYVPTYIVLVRVSNQLWVILEVK